MKKIDLVKVIILTVLCKGIATIKSIRDIDTNHTEVTMYIHPTDYHEIRFKNGAVLQYRSTIKGVDQLEGLLDESNFRFLECDTWRVN